MPHAIETDGQPPASHRALWLLGFLALAARLFDLARRDLWVDEAITWHFARLLGSFQLGEQLLLEPTPPLHYALIGALLRLCGDSDLVMRLPSALAGAASAPLLAWLGERLGWRRAGLFGGVLLAFHPLHLFLSREARVYPLLLMLVLLLAIALWRALEPGAPRRAFVAVAGWLTLILYSHLFGLFVAAAVALLVLVLAADGAARRRGLLATAAALALFAPFLIAAGPALRTSGASWSQEVFYQSHPEEWALPRIYEGHLVGARYYSLHRELAMPDPPPLLRWPAVAAQSLLLLAAAALCWRSAGDRRALIFAGCFYLLPFVLPWAAGMVAGKVFLQPGRHDFLVLGPLCLLLGAGFEALRRRARTLAWLLILPIAAAGLFRLAWLHFLPVRHPAFERGQYLAAKAAPGDLAICFDLERLLGERYTRLSGGSLEFVSFPAETDLHPGYSDPRPLLAELPRLREEARTLIAAREGAGRIFLLGGRGGASRPADAAFLRLLEETGWRLEDSRDDLRLQVWSRR